MNAKEIISRLQLKPHPEGGFYKETYRSDMLMTTSVGNQRNVSTAIYYLLEDQDKSHFHRIKSDEIWFFHQGSPLEIILIQHGKIETLLLGSDLDKGEQFQVIVSAGVWFAAHLQHESGFALVSCTVAPGFDFLDFEMAQRKEMLLEYPYLIEFVEEFTCQV